MTNTCELIFKRKVGGSIIEKRPVFSADEKYLCVIEKESVCTYNTQSGECVSELYPPVHIISNIVGIAIHDKFIFGVTSKGFLIKGSLEVPQQFHLQKLALPHANFTVFDVVLLDRGQDESEDSLVELCLLMSVDTDELHDNRVTICSFIANKKRFKKNHHFSVLAKNDIRSISFGGRYEKIFIGTIIKNKLRVYSYENQTCVNHTKCSNATVVRAHPVEDCVAVGNKNGQIYIYYNVLKEDSKQLMRTFYAWHTLPVMDVIFTPNGSYMYSGGSECVLVKWNVFTPVMRHFLPRLPAPIVHFSISPQNSLLAVSLQNNSIHLVNPQLDVACSIQHFTWGLITIPGQKLFPAGISYEPNTHSLILNGRPGHIQFLSLKTHKLLYNLEITETNYLTQEPDAEIFNLDVTGVAFSQDGKWLATVETRVDPEVSPEVHMKIWAFDAVKQNFTLNTYCDLPHQDVINTVKFQPINSLDNEERSEYYFVTTGNDKKFRVWSSGPSQVDNKRNIVWKCERIGFYKDYTAGPAGFSSDGSVLAVGFGPCLTIWDIDNHDLVTSLARDNETLTFVEIEQTNYSHLAVSASTSALSVWNLLTLTVLWIVPLKISVLVADPLSEYMAAFTSDNTLYVFKPSNPQPIYEKRAVCTGGKVLEAIFVPQNDIVKSIVNLPNWMHNSQLYIINSLQELICLEVDSSVDNNNNNNRKSIEDIMAHADGVRWMTPFAALKAKQIKVGESDSGSVFKSSAPVGLVKDKAIRELLSLPIHTMPQIHHFCNDFLVSFTSTHSSPKTVKGVGTVKKMKKKKNQKSIHIKEIIDTQKDEFDRTFNSEIGLDKESMDVDNDSDTSRGLDLIDFNDDPVDDVDESDKKTNNEIFLSVNRMYSNMIVRNTNGDKSSNKKRKLKIKSRKSKSEFVIDDVPDLGLLNLFENN